MIDKDEDFIQMGEGRLGEFSCNSDGGTISDPFFRTFWSSALEA